jgi:hypothetical protein
MRSYKVIVKEINTDIKLLALSNELKPFLALYQALKVFLKDSIILLFVSLTLVLQGYV